MRTRKLIGFFALLLSLGARVAFAQEKAADQTLRVRCIAGLPKIKHNAGGNLLIQDAALHFDAGKHRAAVAVSSIEDIFTGSETTDAGGMLVKPPRAPQLPRRTIAALRSRFSCGKKLTS